MKEFIIKFFATISAILIIILLYGFLISPRVFKTNEIKIKTNLITDNFDGFKIVHLSDIYYGTTVDEDMLNNIVKEVNLLKPDIVVLTGDLLSKNITYGEVKTNAITGDNDNDIWEEIIEKSDFINLNDTYELIYNNGNIPIVISGISSTTSYGELVNKVTNFESYMENSEVKPCYSILLMHEPDFADYINNDNYNLILAGHSLGGINLPIIGRVKLSEGAKKYDYGYFNIKNTSLYVSNGLGTNRYSYRLMNKPSINFYRIVK